MISDPSLSSVLSTEARLLLLTAGGKSNDASIATVLRGSEEMDWGKMSWLTDWERGTGVVWRRLQSVAPSAIPEDHALSWERLAMVADFHSLYLQERFLEIVRALVDAGVEVILLKGAALAFSAYGGFKERPMGDVDILVEPAQAQLAWDVATSLGWSWDRNAYPEVSYRGHHHLPPLTDTRGVGAKLELHTALSVFGHPFALGYDAVRRSSRGLRVADRDVQALDDNHQVVHLGVHLAWSHMLSFGAWRTFRDLNAVVGAGRVDWDTVAQAARTHGASSCCYWTLRLARSLSGIDVPSAALDLLKVPTPRSMRGIVERHLATQLFATERVCPSESVRRTLWSAAIRPGRLRLGEGRPWDIDAVTAPSAGQPVSYSRRVGNQVESMAQWLHYLSLVLLPRREKGSRRAGPQSEHNDGGSSPTETSTDIHEPADRSG
ncbi:MAG: nucleotidyltransferase family protein [Gemmatimonadaceae bacterium]